eukprot:TRINITY_DN62674_c0_g1_i1.p1 TRINITY_DN62674_c0_g1~~TRINITY_DN62674_c0_g1_i1.p1  ORF type:complete len:476 (-),score=83.35 TRINITY_DN62674_c0_g1_i1:191-1618(-)
MSFTKPLAPPPSPRNKTCNSASCSLKLPPGAFGAVETGQSLADVSVASSSRSSPQLPGASAAATPSAASAHVATPLAASALLPAPAARRPFTAPRARILADLPLSSGPGGPGLLPATPLHRCSRSAARPRSAQPAHDFGKPNATQLPNSPAAWESFGSSLEMIGSSFADIPFGASLLDQSSGALPILNWPACQASKPKSAGPGRLDRGPRAKTRPESAPCVRRLLHKLASGACARPWMEHDLPARELVPGITVPQGWSYLAGSQELLASSSSVQVSDAEPSQLELAAQRKLNSVPASSTEGVQHFAVHFEKKKTHARPDATTKDDAPGKRIANLTPQLEVSPELDAMFEKAQLQRDVPDQPDAGIDQAKAGADGESGDLTALQASITAALTRNWSGPKQGVLKTSSSAGSLLPRRRISAPRRAGKGMPYVLKEPFPEAPSHRLTANICGIEALLAGRRAAWSKCGLVDEMRTIGF